MLGETGDPIHKLCEKVLFWQPYGRKCYTNTLPMVNIEPKTLVFDEKSTVSRLPSIDSKLPFGHRIEDDKPY